MRLIRTILIIALCCCIYLFVSVYFAYQFIDDATIEQQALTILKKNLQREISLQGPLTLSRSLTPTLHAKGIKIAGAKWDQADHFIEAEEFKVGIRLTDLLLGKVHIENAELNKTKITLTRNHSGMGNWELSRSINPVSHTIPLYKIDLIITDLIIRYVDKKTSTHAHYKLDTLHISSKDSQNLQLKGIGEFDKFPVIFDLTMCNPGNQLSNQDCEIDGMIRSHSFTVELDGNVKIGKNNIAENINATLSGTNINEFTLPTSKAFPDTTGILVKASLSGPFNNLTMNNIEGHVSLQKTQIRLNGRVGRLNPLGDVNLNIDAQGTKPAWLNGWKNIFSGDQIEQFSFLGNLVSARESIKNSQQNQSANTRDLQHDWHIDGIKARMDIANNNITFYGDASLDKEGQPEFNVNLNISGENLATLSNFTHWQLPTSDQFHFNTAISYKNGIINVDDINAVFNQSDIQGHIIADINPQPIIYAKLQSELIDFNELSQYMQNHRSRLISRQGKDHFNSIINDKKLAPDWLNNMDAAIQVTADTVKYRQLKLHNLQSTFSAQNRQADLKIDALNFQNAHVKSAVHYNSITGHTNLAFHTESFSIGEFLSQLDITNPVKGKLDLSVNLSASGSTTRQLSNSLNGNLTAIITDGTLNDGYIDLLASNLLMEMIDSKTRQEETRVECLFMQLSGENGLFLTDAAILNTENIIMTADGSIDLSSEQIDLLLSPKPKDIALFTLDSNIRLNGSVYQPSISLDTNSLVKKVLEGATIIALGPAALAIPFTSLGSAVKEKCFNEVRNFSKAKKPARIKKISGNDL